MRVSPLRIGLGAVLLAAFAAALVVLASGGPATPRHAARAANERSCPRGFARERDGGERDRDAGTCKRIGAPETYGEVLKANAALASRVAAPYSSVRSGAYAHAIRQRDALARSSGASAAASEGSWSPVGSTPLITDNTDYDQSNGSTSEGFVYTSGRIDSFTRSASGAIYAAPSNGGVWKTTDNGGHWTSVGDGLPTQVLSSVDWSPARGGTLLALSGDNAFAFATLSGLGAFWSTDDGATWHHAAGIPNGVLGFRLRVDPSNPNIVYAATGDGLFRSTDAGQTFTNVDLPTGPCHGNSLQKDCFLANMVTDVVVQGPSNAHGGRPGAVLAAVGWRAGQKKNADGSMQSPNNGIYVSNNGAPGTFTKIDPSASGFVNGDQTAIGRTALGIANGPDQNHAIVYALVEDANKMNGTFGSDALDEVPTGAPGSTLLNGVWASNDFGHTWHELESSTVLDNDQTSGSALEPVGKEQSYEPGVQAWYNEWIEPDPTQTASNGAPKRVAMGLEEIWESDSTPLTDANGVDGTTPTTFRVIGRYWNSCDFILNGAPKCGPGRGNGTVATNRTTTHPDQHAGMFVPDGSGGVTLFAGNDGGSYAQHVGSGGDFSNNGWGDGAQTGLHTLEPYDAEIAKDGVVYMGMQDNGEGKITPDGRQYEVFGGDGFFTGVDPNNSNYAYEEYSAGVMSATTDGGRNWVDIDPGLTSPQFSTPFIVDPNNAKHVMIGGRDVEETVYGADTCSATDGSNCWKKVYDLGTQKHPGDSNQGSASDDPDNQLSAVDLRSDAAYVGYCGFCDTITQAVTPSAPFKNGIATNVGGNDSPQEMTSSGWHIAKAAGLPNRYISSIAMNPDNENQLFVALAGYGRHWAPPGAVGDDTSRVGKGHVFFSSNAGQSFRDVSGDLPDTPADWVLLRGGRIVVATDIGVFISQNLNGGHYTLLSGLPNVPVFHLVLKSGDPSTMVAATYGRGVYKFHFSSAARGPSSNQTGCGDLLPPRTSISRHSLRARRSALRMSGRSIDRKCRYGLKAAGKKNAVPRVQVYVARVTGGGKKHGHAAKRRCRFLQKNGRLSHTRSCRRPIWLKARTRYNRKRRKTAWRYTARRPHLPHGRYVTQARGIDAYHHVERKLRKHNTLHFKIR